MVQSEAMDYLTPVRIHICLENEELSSSDEDEKRREEILKRSLETRQRADVLAGKSPRAPPQLLLPDQPETVAAFVAQ